MIIRTDSRSVTARRRRALLYTLLILMVAIGVPLYLSKRLNPGTEKPAENKPVETSTEETANQPQTLATELNNTPKETPAASTTTTKTENKNTTTKTNGTKTAGSSTTTTTTTTTTPQSSPSGSIALDGPQVSSPDGYKITLPKNWPNSVTNENGANIINFGTKDFGPSNPYDASMPDDGYGYAGPQAIMPTEAVGPMTSSGTIQTNAGLSVEKKVFQSNTSEFQPLTQVLYTFSLNGKNYSLIYYTNSKNTTQLDAVEAIVKSLQA